MKRKFVVIGCIMLWVGLLSFKRKGSTNFVVPAGWPQPIYNFKNNPLSKEKVALGKKLFYDPVLSRDSTISCSSCHLQYTAFTHVDHDLSHGIGGQLGKRNSPALMNLAWNTSFMWDGAVNHLDVQALAPISNPVEMDESIANVIRKLQRSSNYPGLFYSAFHDSAITGEHVLKAISQFMLTLVSANSKYDRVKRNEEIFTEQEERGYHLFIANCSSCHTEPLFTNQQFENNGLVPDDSLHDVGRMAVSHNKSDSLKFKVPTLRNIEYSHPYMHDGRFKTLSQVLSSYVKSGRLSPSLSPQLQKEIHLTSNERIDLIAFLLTLTDKEFLYNPEFSYR